MEGSRKSTTSTSSSRYWQAYPCDVANDERDVHPRAELRARERRDEAEWSEDRAAQRTQRLHYSQDPRLEIRPTMRVREPQLLVPTISATTRGSSQAFEQRTISYGLERTPLSINRLQATSSPRERSSLHQPESAVRQQWIHETVNRAALAPPTTARAHSFEDIQGQQLRPRDEILRQHRVDSHRHEHESQQGPRYWLGRVKEESRTQGRVVDDGSPRYLPAQRPLPSLMERRSLSSLSDTSTPSSRLGDSPVITSREALNHRGLFTQARREFPQPRFSFPVNSPSLFSVVGPQQRPSASADDLLTGRAAKVSARAVAAEPPAVQTPPSPEPKKKVRRTRLCTIEGCVKLVVDHGVCIRHGGGKRCNVEGCECRAQNRGLCWKHGGYTICTVDCCGKRAKSRGMCWSHGGGTRCKEENCAKIAVSRGRCWAHGGGKRCKMPNCQKPAALRLNDYCSEHHMKNKRQAMGHPTSPT